MAQKLCAASLPAGGRALDLGHWRPGLDMASSRSGSGGFHLK
jgi:hypothetical protein